MREASHSGLVHTLGKRAGCQSSREFESPRLRHKIMFYTYIIQSAVTKKFYIGSTSDLNERMTRHNGNRESATKHKGPWQIIHQEKFLTRAEAVRREKQIKSYKGGRAFKKLIYLRQ